MNFSLPKITQYANLLQPTVLHRRNDSICWKKGISRKDEYLRGENVLCMLAYSKWLNVQDVRRITTLIASQIGPNKKGKFCSFALSKRRSAVLLHNAYRYSSTPIICIFSMLKRGAKSEKLCKPVFVHFVELP